MKHSELYRLACNENAIALDFLNGWVAYTHAIDDFIDGKEKDPNKLLDILAMANILYSSDFYQQFDTALSLTVVKITNDFADSIAWIDGETWQRDWADRLRFAGNDMVLAIAAICGGFERVRLVSLLLRVDSWRAHHDNDGKPI